MSEPEPAPASRPPLYSRSPVARLWHRAGRLVPLALVVAIGCSTAGCSFSYKLGSLWGKDKDDDTPEYTGSIRPAPAALPAAAGPGRAAVDADLAYAKAAAAEVLARGDKDASASWENPATGARGTVTPLASAYAQDGFTCRDFLASHVRDGTESWFQGEACRLHKGRWDVKAMRPWKRT